MAIIQISNDREIIYMCSLNSQQDNCGCRCNCDPDNNDPVITRRFDCGRTCQVIKHCHTVNHRHDIINEYDVVHEHEFNYFDVVRERDVVRHNDHTRHDDSKYCERRPPNDGRRR